MIYPTKLAIFYPHQGMASPLSMAFAAVLLALMTIFSIGVRKKCPFLIVGWFWFLGTLVPVIGLIQIGAHAMANRFMYIPSVGLFIILVWGVSTVIRYQKAARVAILICSGLYPTPGTKTAFIRHRHPNRLVTTGCCRGPTIYTFHIRDRFTVKLSKTFIDKRFTKKFAKIMKLA